MQQVVERHLFGGAISCCFPERFQNVSEIRQVPDNQEVFADASRDESIIVELLELKKDIGDENSAVWFLQDLADEQDAKLEIDAVSAARPDDVPYIDASVSKSLAQGKMAVSKARQGADAANLVKVYLGNLRLRNVMTDVLITVYEPLYISASSQSASVVGAGPVIPPNIAGCVPAQDVFQLLLKTFKVVDWGLFG